jgi:site-specific DNA-methyltransferase (adenine-specific)
MNQIHIMGAGTTAVVAKKLGRQYAGSELNQKYIDIAERRLRRTMRQEELGI